MLPISPSDARQAGLTRYFTGKPCTKGHVSARNLKNRECIACALDRSAKDPNKAARTKASAQRNRAARAEKRKARYWSEPEALREYNRVYRADRLECHREREQRQRVKFAEKRRQYALDRYLTDRVSVRAASAKWAKANPDKVAARTAKRKAAKLQATPTWADHDKIAAFYALARKLSDETGVPHDVDHIIPLQGKNVCGLHVHTNLRVISRSENARKRNKFDEAMIDDAVLGEDAQ